METSHRQCAGVYGDDSMACSPCGKYTMALFLRRGSSNRDPALRTLSKGKRMQALRSYESLGEARNAMPTMKKEVKVSIATLKRGECVESSLSPLNFSQSLLLRNEASIGKIGAFWLPKVVEE